MPGACSCLRVRRRRHQAAGDRRSSRQPALAEPLQRGPPHGRGARTLSPRRGHPPRCGTRCRRSGRGPPDDPSEAEADRAADRVVDTPEPAGAPSRGATFSAAAGSPPAPPNPGKGATDRGFDFSKVSILGEGPQLQRAGEAAKAHRKPLILAPVRALGSRRRPSGPGGHQQSDRGHEGAWLLSCPRGREPSWRTGSEWTSAGCESTPTRMPRSSPSS